MKLISIICVSTTLLVGCPGDDNPLPTGPANLIDQDAGSTGGDTGGTTGEDPPPDVPAPPPGENSLEFQVPVDVTGSPCAVQCLYAANPGDPFALSVIYKAENGSPINAGLITYATDAPEDQVKFSAKSAYTDAAGKASVDLLSFATTNGSVTVTARAQGDNTTATLTFKITFAPVTLNPLEVTVKYVGNGAVADFEIRLYRQEQNGSPLCADVHPDSTGPEVGFVTKQDGLTHSSTYKFGSDRFPTLHASGTESYVVQVVGPDEGALSANGCEQAVVLEPTKTTELTVEVGDLPVQYTGSYETSTDMDLQNGAPPIVSTLISLFNNPGEVAIKAACDNPDGFVLEAGCGYLMNGSELSSVGETAAKAASDLFFQYMAAELGNGVFDAQAMAQLLSDVRFKGTLNLGAEPVADTANGGGMFPAGTVSETWDFASFKFNFGAIQQMCAGSEDEDCARIQIKLSEIYGYTLQANMMGAGIDTFDRVRIDSHTVAGFKYGTLVNFLVERMLLKEIFGPGIDSYDEIISMIFGDASCISDNDCCQVFAVKVQNDVPALAAELFCDVAIPVASQWIRGQLENLIGELVIGTPADLPCPALDLKPDRAVDSLGKPTAGEQCHWDASFGSFSPPSKWWGKR